MINLTPEQVATVESKYGSPFYIFDETAFIENYRNLGQTMQTIYPQYRIAYSFKTNYTPYVCKLIRALGGKAEVVSAMERYIAERIGYQGSEIIYNGPDKQQDGLDAILCGNTVNVDNLNELESICSFVAMHPAQQFTIGMRVNLDLGQSFVSRFGMDERDLVLAFKKVGSIPNLSVAGLHCHISRCRSVEAWRRRTEYMLSLTDKLFVLGTAQFIDLGSGMYGQMDADLHRQFDYVPTYQDYALATAQLMADHYRDIPDEQKPVLITEPGTTLINKYVDFFGRVDAIKTIAHKTFVILNCSEHNLGETCTLKTLPMRIMKTNNCRVDCKDADFVGYTCLEQDVMYRNYSGSIAIGDIVQFGNVGGYSNVYKPPFIRPNCAMVVLKPSGEFQLMKRSETYADLLNTYVLS